MDKGYFFGIPYDTAPQELLEKLYSDPFYPPRVDENGEMVRTMLLKVNYEGQEYITFEKMPFHNEGTYEKLIKIDPTLEDRLDQKD